MPKGIPRTDEERTERHFGIFGTTAPTERLGLGQFSGILPMSPMEGPPLPQFLDIKWSKLLPLGGD